MTLPVLCPSSPLAGGGPGAGSPPGWSALHARRVPCQEHPGQGDVLELAQVAEVIVSGQTVLTRPAERFTQLAPARPAPVPSTPGPAARWGRSRPHRRARPRRAGRVRRPDLLRPRVPEPSRPASDTVLRQPEVLAQFLAAQQISRGRRQIVALAMDLAQADVHVGRSAQHGAARAAVHAAMPARTCAWPRRDDLASSRMSASAIAQPKVSATCPARRSPATHSAYAECPASRSPLAQNASPSRPAAEARPRWSSSGDEFERPPGVRHACRARRPGPGPGRRGTADHRRETAEFLVVDDDHFGR